MNTNEENILKALKASMPEFNDSVVTPASKFQDVKYFDSMAVINFQTQLSKSIGEKAFDITPMMEMTISQYAALLE